LHYFIFFFLLYFDINSTWIVQLVFARSLVDLSINVESISLRMRELWVSKRDDGMTYNVQEQAKRRESSWKIERKLSDEFQLSILSNIVHFNWYPRRAHERDIREKSFFFFFILSLPSLTKSRQRCHVKIRNEWLCMFQLCTVTMRRSRENDKP
jgi:hypothetical protein